MKRLAIVLAAALALGACSTPQLENTPRRSGLPDVPADIRRCFNTALGRADGDLTVAQVEAAWKADRVKAVVMRQCGSRFLAWYDDLRKRWR